MADVPYTKTIASIPRFMSHIQDAGVPDKVTQKYLKSVGFTSSNDSYLLGLLKGIGFIDNSGGPTPRWKSYRDKSQAPRVMAEAVRDGYAGLFAVYADAFRRDDEAITNYIRGNTDYAGDTVSRALGSFKALCALADFAKVDGSPAQPPAKGPEHPPASESIPVVTTVAPAPVLPGRPAVTINIELQLPASADKSTYDDFFAAMRKHLFDDNPPA